MRFGRKAFFFAGTLALGAAMSAAGRAEAERVRKARRLTGVQIAWLVVFAVLALVIVSGLVKAGAGPLVLLPPIAWFYALRGFRNANERRARQPVVRQGSPKGAIKRVRPTAPEPPPNNRAIPPHEIDGRQREQQRRESVARKNSERMRRVEELGAQGTKLYGRAEFAVREILSTEAVRSGWLGDLQENDFGADLELIAANSRAANELGQLINELSGIPNPNDEDRGLVEEARRKVSQLDRQSRERVALLEKCRERATLVDLSIRKEREQAAIAEKRDDVHGRMAAALYGADAGPYSPPSAPDRVLAFESAYRDIKGLDERGSRPEAQTSDRKLVREDPNGSRPRGFEHIRKRLFK